VANTTWSWRWTKQRSHINAVNSGGEQKGYGGNTHRGDTFTRGRQGGRGEIKVTKEGGQEKGGKAAKWAHELHRVRSGERERSHSVHNDKRKKIDDERTTVVVSNDDEQIVDCRIYRSLLLSLCLLRPGLIIGSI
jgi:hypothetical protein